MNTPVMYMRQNKWQLLALPLFLAICALGLLAVGVATNGFKTPNNGNSVTTERKANSVTGSQGFGPRVTLPKCSTEDSDNCYWDARTMGNGPERIARGLNPGQSFVTIDGKTYYLAG